MIPKPKRQQSEELQAPVQIEGDSGCHLNIFHSLKKVNNKPDLCHMHCFIYPSVLPITIVTVRLWTTIGFAVYCRSESRDERKTEFIWKRSRIHHKKYTDILTCGCKTLLWLFDLRTQLNVRFVFSSLLLYMSGCTCKHPLQPAARRATTNISLSKPLQGLLAEQMISAPQSSRAYRKTKTMIPIYRNPRRCVFPPSDLSP